MAPITPTQERFNPCVSADYSRSNCISLSMNNELKNMEQPANRSTKEKGKGKETKAGGNERYLSNIREKGIATDEDDYLPEYGDITVKEEDSCLHVTPCNSSRQGEPDISLLEFSYVVLLYKERFPGSNGLDLFRATLNGVETEQENKKAAAETKAATTQAKGAPTVKIDLATQMSLRHSSLCAKIKKAKAYANSLDSWEIQQGSPPLQPVTEYKDEIMFENLCTLPLTSELFTQVLHPTEPILSVGLSGGHVQSFRLPPSNYDSSNDGDVDSSVLSTGTSTIETEWRTRRHKGSCRTLAYSYDGAGISLTSTILLIGTNENEVLYSAGTDSLLKAADSETGQVLSKILVPPSPTSSPDPPTLIHSLSPQTLLLATDSAAFHLYDMRSPSSFLKTKPAQTHRPHDDYISSLTPLKPTDASTSGYSKQWLTTGGTTIAITDLRRGVLVKSEDQEEELLSSVFVGGLPAKPGRSKGEKVLVGSGNGVITLWERGVWDDQDERIIVDKGIGGGESLDVLVLMPEETGGGGKFVGVGVGDGTVRIVKLGINKVVAALKHDEMEGVVGLGVDVHGRLISGGGSIVKIWEEDVGEEEDQDEGEDNAKRPVSESGSESDSDSEDSKEEARRQRKKQKKAKAKNKSSGNGILGFKAAGGVCEFYNGM
ncbi:hypothetical protein B7494_g3550 [Chlorociboria aeruginascens]|nr:hypothetical protein B7494_g3550 [Chlorociboria aeruginascens]